MGPELSLTATFVALTIQEIWSLTPELQVVMMKWAWAVIALLAVLMLAQFLSWIRYRDELEGAAAALARVKSHLAELEMRNANECARVASELEVIQLELELLRTDFDALLNGPPSSVMAVAPQDQPPRVLPRFHDVDRAKLPSPPLPFMKYDDLSHLEQGLIPGYPAAVYKEGSSILQYVVLMQADGTYSYDNRELQLALDLLEATRESERFLTDRLASVSDERIERWPTLDEALDSERLKDPKFRAVAAADDKVFVYPADLIEGDPNWKELEGARRRLADELQQTIANVIVGSSVIPPEE